MTSVVGTVLVRELDERSGFGKLFERLLHNAEALSVRRLSSQIPRRFLRAYVSLNRRIWVRVPASLRVHSLGQAYGRHLHALVQRLAERGQGQGTFFFRKLPELGLM